MQSMFVKVLVVLVVSVFSVMAAPFNPVWVSGDANWVMHVDFAALRASQIGKALLSEDLNAAGQEQLQQAKEMFGMDPRTDLDAVTLYGGGRGQDDVVVLVGGKLDADKLVAQLKGMTGYTVSSLGAREVHSWLDEQGEDASRVHGVILDGSRSVASKSVELLQKALAVLDGKQGNLTQGGTLDTSVLSGSGLLLAATADLRNVDLSANPMLANAKAGVFRMQMRESGGDLALRVAMQQESAQEAQQAESMLNGFKMMGLMQMQQQNPDLAGLMQAITITRNDDMLMLQMSYPAAKIVEMIKAVAQSGSEE
ncbi:MAG: hypothetical protein ACNA71_09110 [Kiritimatiellia bacterium]